MTVQEGSKVAQLDAILLDNELLNSLIFQFNETFSQYYKQRVIKYSNEIKLLIRSLLFKFTLWDTSETYGFMLSNLKLRHANIKPLTKKIKIAYFLLFIFGDYLLKKINDKVFNEDNFNDNELNIRNLMRSLLINFSKILKFANFINFINFLINGKFNNLKFWLLNISTTIQSLDFEKSFKGRVNYDFQNRQIIWNTLIEFVEFLTPFLKNLKKFQSRRKQNNNNNNRFLENLQIFNPLSNYLNYKDNQYQDKLKGKNSGESSQLPPGKYSKLDMSQCAICYENGQEKKSVTKPSLDNTRSSLQQDVKQLVSGTIMDNMDDSSHPIISPYITNCGHIYSYLCILEKLEDYSSSATLPFFQFAIDENTSDEYDDGFENKGTYWCCLRCNRPVIWCAPYTKQHEDFQLEESESESESEEENSYQSEKESYHENEHVNHIEKTANDNNNASDSESSYDNMSSYEDVEEKYDDDDMNNQPNENQTLDFGASQVF